MNNYFKSIEVSNSDLSWLKNLNREQADPTKHYNFGTLFDLLVTEPHKVDYNNMTADKDKRLPIFECNRCGHQWHPRTWEPKFCPKCHSPYWNSPRVRTKKEN